MLVVEGLACPHQLLPSWCGVYVLCLPAIQAAFAATLLSIGVAVDDDGNSRRRRTTSGAANLELPLKNAVGISEGPLWR